MALDRTPSGAPSAEARDKKAVLSGGRFPIGDRKSALAALKLRGRAKSKDERRKIINAAARWAPAEAKAARQADEKDGSI
jgi:hypothetical protein